MPVLCYVPVLPFGCKGNICHFFGYDTKATLPYVLQIDLETYGQQPFAMFNGVEGVLYGTVFIPPFSMMHPNEVSARIEIDDVITLRDANGKDAAR